MEDRWYSEPAFDTDTVSIEFLDGGGLNPAGEDADGRYDIAATIRTNADGPYGDVLDDGQFDELRPDVRIVNATMLGRLSGAVLHYPIRAEQLADDHDEVDADRFTAFVDDVAGIEANITDHAHNITSVYLPEDVVDGAEDAFRYVQDE